MISPVPGRASCPGCVLGGGTHSTHLARSVIVKTHIDSALICPTIDGTNSSTESGFSLIDYIPLSHFLGERILCSLFRVAGRQTECQGETATDRRLLWGWQSE